VDGLEVRSSTAVYQGKFSRTKVLDKLFTEADGEANKARATTSTPDEEYT
jgi:hypothetical protein